jgi:hypothetical protein
MAIVAIVHLQVVNVGFVPRSSGQMSQIQLLPEQKQRQSQNQVWLRGGDKTPLSNRTFLKHFSTNVSSVLARKKHARCMQSNAKIHEAGFTGQPTIMPCSVARTLAQIRLALRTPAPLSIVSSLARVCKLFSRVHKLSPESSH